ncbi:hypothetical protein SERLA73DRAFT_150208 [Serpula lacrymans var. lacrymans S7.3]|uniref:Uncharacterized protein n=1 Tax=Serpula lacrymans var. lacrymans (strain S7.3) TaxID=936435 RepID=F8PLI1_SERL3|nr:hypothetical protein SERLA73DRAFT_150208 [Serpula lacrymans var. lacrymans S7.3]
MAYTCLKKTTLESSRFPIDDSGLLNFIRYFGTTICNFQLGRYSQKVYKEANFPPNKNKKAYPYKQSPHKWTTPQKSTSFRLGSIQEVLPTLGSLVIKSLSQQVRTIIATPSVGYILKLDKEALVAIPYQTLYQQDSGISQ